MDTRIINFYEDGFKDCVNEIRENGVVVFPTETVYGIGGNALSPQAINKIFEVKNRERDNPLIVHVCDYDISKYVKNVSEDSKKLIDKFWPGPLTIIFEKSSIIPYETTGGRESVGLRMPNNEIALKLIKESGCPIAAPSANISGRPSGTNSKRCFEDLKGKVKFIIDGCESKIGLESTVISMINDEPIILRPGYVTLQDIQKVLPRVKMYERVNEKILDENPISPGMKYKHYAPKGKMVIVKGNMENIRSYVKQEIINHKKVGVLCFKENYKFYREISEELNLVVVGSKSDLNEIGKNLFESIRRFDDLNCDFIISECLNEDFSTAIMNRLLKAASFNVITF